MQKYIKISKKPRILYRLTGLTIEQFTALCTKLKPLWEKTEKKRLSQRERKRTLGQGRRYKLSTLVGCNNNGSTKFCVGKFS
ncbi:MAG: hypothetical protein A3G70_02795 [Planctomycetes bacterium RIFCSPLOWO2_12_FULL_39_13]|nr:MAG: hypothetical protein A3G70_02795 [Planctomycetes bacterium RIFCSPLOWO2_12_FULL_39_13]